MEWPAQDGCAGDGVVATLNGLEPGCAFSVTVAASNGREVGTWSKPLTCCAAVQMVTEEVVAPEVTEQVEAAPEVLKDKTAGTAKRSSLGAPRPSMRRSMRAQSVQMQPQTPRIRVERAGLLSPGTAGFAWAVNGPPMPSTSRWLVQLWHVDEAG